MSVETGQHMGDIRRVFALHGYQSSPRKKMFQWLALEGLVRGIEVSALEFPEPDDPSAARWQDTLDRQLAPLQETMGIVTHSLGGISALRYLTRDDSDWRLGTLVLVAPFASRFDAIPSPIEEFCGEVDWGKIRARVGCCTVIRSDNDELVPASASDEVAAALGVEPVIVSGAAHFRDADGVVQVPEVRDAAFRLSS